jgi:hypothetical protein
VNRDIIFPLTVIIIIIVIVLIFRQIGKMKVFKARGRLKDTADSWRPASDAGTNYLMKLVNQIGKMKVFKARVRLEVDATDPWRPTSDAGTNYLMKLVNVADAQDQIVIYIKGGKPFITDVPPGRYYIRAASGNTWQGHDVLFGSNTIFFKLIRIGTKDGVFEFPIRSGGYQIILYKTTRDPTMTIQSIRRDQF